jgi:sulfur carrier protein ThiS
MAEVFIAEPFRRLTGGEKSRNVEGGTILEVLVRLGDQHPPVRDKLLNRDGTPRASFLIYLDDRVIPRKALETTRVDQDSRIKIFTVMGGG